MAAKLIPFPKHLLAEIPASQVVYDREGRVLRVFLNRDGNFLIPMDPADVSPHLVDATIAVEDQRFMSHGGVDCLAVLRACLQNAAAGRVVSGASTITMQVVRLLEPKPRTLWAKLSQAFRALQLERAHTKEEILALYLTLAPYGGNLYGAEAAALAYFGKRASGLTLPEAALLAGLPQSPSRLRPDLHPGKALNRRETVLNAMVRDQVIPASQRMLFSVDAPDTLWTGGANPFEKRLFPFRAPHAARYLTQRYKGLFRIHTTLDGALQKRAAAFLKRQVRKFAGVSNMACLAVDNRTGEVLVYVGSCDFWSEADAGQVDGLRAFRSPGSTLKPFLYALCYENGKLAPDEQIPDLPLMDLPWQPDNFDRTFHGIVPVREALAESYNLPAVRLLFRYGMDRFLGFLEDKRLVRLETVPSPAMILGAVAVRPVDLVKGYMALGRFGTSVPLRYLKNRMPERLVCPGFNHERALLSVLTADAQADADRPQHYFSPVAGYLVAETLTREAVPGRRLQGYAWKTGTSWGRRDAWTVAYTPRFTVCLWAGNFSGQPSSMLTGAGAAMPCAVEILSWLDPSPDWPARPEGMTIGAVCRETGLPAGPFCTDRIMGRCLAHDHRTCDVHRRFPVDSKTGTLLCRHCIQHEGIKSVDWRVFPLWPPAVEACLVMRGKTPVPPHFAGCPVAGGSAVAGRRELAFVSPVAGAQYQMTSGRIPVEVFSAGSTLFFFLDGKLVKTDAKRFMLPVAAGWHTLACIDAQGRHARIRFRCLEKR